MGTDRALTRIGVFYDGNYFLHVSNYYKYVHQRRTRISVNGMHEFIRDQVAIEEETSKRHCHIVDAHYFRGRLHAAKAEQRDLLMSERRFEDVLIREGIITHYLPLTPNGEKGIDVWFALEAFELAIHKKFDVTVLIACDSDYVPLVRKLNTLGTRVMVLAWDFKYLDNDGIERETRTSQALLDEVTYPVLMHNIIDDRTNKNNAIINNLFIAGPEFDDSESALHRYDSQQVQTGTVKVLKEGYGFIKPDQSAFPDIYFFHASLVDIDFNELNIGDRVRYFIGKNDKGPKAENIQVIESL